MNGAVSLGPSVRSHSSPNGRRETMIFDSRFIVARSIVVLTNANAEPSSDRLGCDTAGTS